MKKARRPKWIGAHDWKTLSRYLTVSRHHDPTEGFALRLAALSPDFDRQEYATRSKTLRVKYVYNLLGIPSRTNVVDDDNKKVETR